jgi:hypothetical protein
MVSGALAVAYLVLTFGLSAALVRAAPHSRVARRLRLDLICFPLLPALLALLLAQSAGTGIGHLAGAMQSLFARLSGHRPYQRHRSYYRCPLPKHGRRATRRRL